MVVDDKSVWLNWTVALLLACVLFLAVVAWVLHDIPSYRVLWNLNSVNQDFAEPFTRQVLMYMDGASNELPVVLTPSENSHLHDIRILIVRARIVLAIALAAFLLFLFTKGKQLSSEWWRQTLRNSMLMLALIPLVSTLSFGFTFTFFHRLLFPPDSWVFDARTTTLVNVYPENFFIGMFVIVTLYCFLASAIGWYLSGHHSTSENLL